MILLANRSQFTINHSPLTIKISLSPTLPFSLSQKDPMPASPASEPRLPTQGAERRYAPLFVLLAALLLYALRFGYDYGASDQDEFLPYLLHRLDPESLSQDWFVVTQGATFSIRTYFVMLLQGLALVVPVWLAVLVLYGGAWLLIAGAVYALSYAFTRNRLAAAAAVVVALVLTPQWTLGGNDLAHSMLAPSMGGWGLGLWGVVFFLRYRPGQAAFLLGTATWMQALVGLQLAGLLGLMLLWRLTRSRRALRHVLLFAGVYALAALPTLGPLVLQQLSGTTPPEAADAPSMFYVLAQFRVPHHYLFYSFPARSLVRFGALMVLGLTSFALLHRKQRVHYSAFLIQTLGCIAAFGILAFLFTEIQPVLFVAQLQLFKTTVLAKLLFVILICGAVFAWLPERIARPLERLMDIKGWGLAAVLGLWILAIGSVFVGVEALRAKAGPLARAGTPTTQVETWARTQTPRDAVFAVPPSWSGFRSRARRAIVVNYKAFPYRDRLNITWFERLTEMAPISLPDRAGPAIQDSLDAAFLRQPAPALHRLAERYDFDYVVRDRPFTPASSSFDQVYSSGEWIVYRIVSEDRPAE